MIYSKMLLHIMGLTIRYETIAYKLLTPIRVSKLMLDLSQSKWRAPHDAYWEWGRIQALSNNWKPFQWITLLKSISECWLVAHWREFFRRNDNGKGLYGTQGQTHQSRNESDIQARYSEITTTDSNQVFFVFLSSQKDHGPNWPLPGFELKREFWIR